MTKLFYYCIVSIVLLQLNSCCTNDNNIKVPMAKKIKTELKKHGDTRIDNYFWLNQRENPEVVNYLKKENEYLEEVMKPTKALQDKLYNEMISRLDPNEESVPYKENGYFYYKKYNKGMEYPIYYRKKENSDNPEEILLDVNELAKGYKYFQVKGLRVSPDNKKLLFGVDTLSRRKYQIYYKNLESEKLKALPIKNTTGIPVWANDNNTFFYTLKDSALKAFRIGKHKLDQTSEEDETVYTENDKSFNVEAYKTKSGKYIVLYSYFTGSDEYRLINADHPDKPFKLFFPRKAKLEYSISHKDEYFYILTNYKAFNFRLMRCKLTNTDIDKWEEIIPERTDVFIESMEVFKNYLVLLERKNGLMNFEVVSLKDHSTNTVKFDEEAYSLQFGDNSEISSNTLRFVYTSLTTPKTIYDYNLNTKTRELLKRDKVIGDFLPENYVTKRLFAKASDGTKIPISLVYKKGFQQNGEAPLFIKGYGSYGYSYDPVFHSLYLSLIDRGFVYAIAHIRGGQEMGRKWYEDGKLLKKKNTFTDFIDCSRFLCQEKYTQPDKLFAYGGSAGGLLMGAVLNMAPELYKGVIAAVPFVDVVTTMLDESIPLTTEEYNEWGNPNEKIYYDYMLSYSPYDNVKKQDYPAILVTTGLYDSQVQYWEPAKWVAKLRSYKTDNNQLLLHTNMSAGHGGASGRYEQFKEDALQFAFVLKLNGMNE